MQDKGMFKASCPPEALVYFLLNVGDGDTQLLLLPERKEKGGRRMIVVDVATTEKLPALIGELSEAGLVQELKDRSGLFPLVVATHPHNDHIGGMPEFLRQFAGYIRELWEPGYYHPIGAYTEMMAALEDADGSIQHTQPTSGTTRYVGRVRLQVLSPAIGLRNRFDSYGVEINNSSIALKVEFPASRVEWNKDARRYVRVEEKRRRLILGGDAQTLAWGKVRDEFQGVQGSYFPAAAALRETVADPSPLNADVFKVPHHGSKHGLNLELVEAVRPSYSLVSSVGGGGDYNFPHLMALEAVREAREPTTSTGIPHKEDWELGIHYTGGHSGQNQLGSLALVIPPAGPMRLWRFYDEPQDSIRLAKGRRFVPS